MNTGAIPAENDLGVYQKRIELLVGARFFDTNRTQAAFQVQDRIRKKVGSWDGSKEIRRWRQQR